MGLSPGGLGLVFSNIRLLGRTYVRYLMASREICVMQFW